MACDHSRSRALLHCCDKDNSTNSKALSDWILEGNGCQRQCCGDSAAVIARSVW